MKKISSRTHNHQCKLIKKSRKTEFGHKYPDQNIQLLKNLISENKKRTKQIKKDRKYNNQPSESHITSATYVCSLIMYGFRVNGYSPVGNLGLSIAKSSFVRSGDCECFCAVVLFSCSQYIGVSVYVPRSVDTCRPMYVWAGLGDRP